MLWRTVNVLVLIHLFARAVRGLSFFVEPMSQNVSEGTEAIFNCTAYSSGYQWLINNELPESKKNKNRGLMVENRIINGSTNLKEHILIVPGMINNSGITIKCFIYSAETQSSSPVTLLVQGLLDAVSNLQAIQLNSFLIFVSYVPPCTLEGIPIRNYSVDIYTPGNTSSMSAYSTSTENITLQIDNPCYEYFISISAWNDVGRGTTASISTILYEVPYPPTSSSAASVEFLSDSSIRAILYTTVSKDCLGRVPDNITIILYPSSEEHSIVTFTSSCLLGNLSCDNNFFSLTESSDEGKVEVSIDLSAVIDQGFYYKTIVLLSNRIGNTTSSTIELNTFHTTSAEVIVAGSVCLKCDFANGNSTEGCLGVFVDRNRMAPNTSITVPIHSGILCFFDFPPGDYNVLIYDSGHTERTVFELRCIVQKPSSSSNVLATVVSSSTISTAEQILSSTAKTSNDKVKSTGTVTEMPVLVITLSVSSGTLMLLLLMVVSLMACLMKYNSKLKNADHELSALQRQRTAEVFLHNLPESTDQKDGFLPTGVTSNGYYDTPTLPAVNPLYESVDKFQQRVSNPNELEMMDCPAYVTMSTKIKNQV